MSEDPCNQLLPDYVQAYFKEFGAELSNNVKKDIKQSLTGREIEYLLLEADLIR